MVIAAGLTPAGKAKAPAEAFTLGETGGDPGPIAFTWALESTVPASLAGPGGAGYIEDPGSPYNTAIGGYALDSNTAGFYNTASGFNALTANDEGFNNTANGALALSFNTSGDSNTASGFEALLSNTTGSFNEASGGYALYSNTTGNGNTAIGGQALLSNTTGRHNTAIGFDAGYNCQGGNSNIYLGSFVMGYTEDTNTIRIGKPYDTVSQSGQTQTFIAGIAETALDASMAPAVVGIASDGRLGKFPEELLPEKGDPGEQGPPGIQGPAGEGFVPGALLFLPAGSIPPAGFGFLGRTDLSLAVPGVKRTTKLSVDVYQKQ